MLVEEFPTSLDGHNYFPLITYFLRGCLLSIAHQNLEFGAQDPPPVRSRGFRGSAA